MRPAREIHIVQSAGFRRIAVVALAVTLLVWPAGAVIAAAEPAPLEATAGPKAGGPATTATAGAMTSTSRPPAGRGPAASSAVLPMVLAALLVLALLDPPPRLYPHRYWHRY
jgi:hypothetical protein